MSTLADMFVSEYCKFTYYRGLTTAWIIGLRDVACDWKKFDTL